VMCYELRMQALELEALNNDALGGNRDAAPGTVELANNEDLERFYTHLEETLLHIGYLNPAAPKKLFERLRRLYARSRLEKEEINLLRGILTLTVTPKKHTKY
jgi:tRNA/rRNA methyltransferase